MSGYEIADFLAYDRDIWLRLIQLYQARWWPLPALWIVCVAVAFLAGISLQRRQASLPTAASKPTGSRLRRGYLVRRWPLLLALAAAWAWITWAFHLQEHQSLNWAAKYWAWAFGGQSLLLLVAAMSDAAGHTAFEPSKRLFRVSRLTFAILILGLLLPPMLSAVLDGRGLLGGEWFGMTPDATSLITLWIMAVPVAQTGPTKSRSSTSFIASKLLLTLVPILSLLVSALLASALQMWSTVILAAVALAVWLILCTVLVLRRQR